MFAHGMRWVSSTRSTRVCWTGGQSQLSAHITSQAEAFPCRYRANQLALRSALTAVGFVELLRLSQSALAFTY
jgi:hypothetical protein